MSNGRHSAAPKPPPPGLARFASSGGLPWRLRAKGAGSLIGVQVDEIRILSSEPVLTRLRDKADPSIKAHLLPASLRLRPLGSPAKQATKYYSTFEILQLCKDRNWLTRACGSIHFYWRCKRKPDHEHASEQS